MTAPKTFQLACPECGCGISTVKDSRCLKDGIRRRRVCIECNNRYTTYETISGGLSQMQHDMRMLERLRDDLRAALAMVSTIIDQEGVSS